MSFDVEGKLVIAIASSALFDLTESDQIYRHNGIDAYRKHQRDHEKEILRTGCAFPFIRRLLNLNMIEPGRQSVEVVLLSRNDPDTGLRVFNSIEHYKLNITRAAFTSGRSPYPYISAFNACLFLSNNESDVQESLAHGFPGGLVLQPTFADDSNDSELRIAFDFDGVLVDDEAERVFKKEGLDKFHSTEIEKAASPLKPGPLKKFLALLSDIAKLQNRDRERRANEPSYAAVLRTAIITARSAPAHKRVVATLRDWGLMPDEVFFLGGMSKNKVLEVFKPHIFFDDQRTHLDGAVDIAPAVHIPFGIANLSGAVSTAAPDKVPKHSSATAKHPQQP
jgi:5'-nucleotidase